MTSSWWRFTHPANTPSKNRSGNDSNMRRVSSTRLVLDSFEMVGRVFGHYVLVEDLSTGDFCQSRGAEIVAVHPHIRTRRAACASAHSRDPAPNCSPSR
jgi:hypothetical protein